MDPESRTEDKPVTWWIRLSECCAWVVSDEAALYIDLIVFGLSFLALWFSMDLGCQLCVFGILLLSLF